MKSCNAKRPRQRLTVKKTTIGLISKKATLHVQYTFTTFFVHFFAVFLDDYNVKLPETSQLQVLWRKCRTCSCSLLFSLPLISTFVAASISHILIAATKFSCCSILPTKNASFVALFLVELRWPVAYFLFFSVFLLHCIPNLWT